MKPVISVLMPLFNAEDFVGQALESVLAQSFGDFECLVMDDGSNDGSAAIVKRLSNTDSRIKYYFQRNKGIAAALNSLLIRAEGRYIVRLDCDDLCRPSRFETQLKYFKNDDDLSILGSKVEVFGGQNVIWHYRQTNLQTRAIQLIGNTCLCHPSLMVKREVYEQFKYRKKYPHLEDMDLYCRFLLKGEGRLYATREVLMDYRLHTDNISKQYSSMQLAQRALCLSALWQQLGIVHDVQDVELFIGPLMGADYNGDMNSLATSVLAIGEQLSRINPAVMTEIERRLSRLPGG